MCLLNFILTLDAEFRYWRSYSEEQENEALSKKRTRGVNNKWKKERKHRDAINVNNVATRVDAAKILREYEQIIKNKKAT